MCLCLCLCLRQEERKKKDEKNKQLASPTLIWGTIHQLLAPRDTNRASTCPEFTVLGGFLLNDKVRDGN